MKLAGINKAIKKGCRVHAFLSGGGLRVVRIEKLGKLKGYGEHPQIEDALTHANEDFLAGGRPYKKVYGGKKPHYLTGSSTSSGPLDQWLLQGHTFDAWQEGDDVVFQLKGLTQVEIPKEICDKVLQTGVQAKYEHRGYTYRIIKTKFPNGEPCTSAAVIKSQKNKKNGADPWMYTTTKTARDKNFWAAMENAFKAKDVEIEQE